MKIKKSKKLNKSQKQILKIKQILENSVMKRPIKFTGQPNTEV